MRALHVINSLGGSGGAEHGLVREISRFAPDVENTVVRLFEKDQIGHQLEAVGIPVIPLGLDASSAGRNWPVGARRLRSIIGDLKPDVLQTSLFAANLVGQLSTRDTPILSTFTLSGESHLLQRYQPGAASLRASMLRKVAGYAAKRENVSFRALTDDAAETNIGLLGVDPSRVTTIPRGVPEFEAERSRAELELPEEVPLLLNVARQAAQKGQTDLIEAFAAIRRSVPAHLVIVGRRGDASAALEGSIASHGLGAHVSLVGYTDDVGSYLHEADLFVFTSFMEGLGTAVVEALSVGLGVVAYDIPPVREATHDGEFAALVEAGNQAAFAETVLAELSSAERRHPERAKAILESHGIEAISRRVEILLRELAA